MSQIKQVALSTLQPTQARVGIPSVAFFNNTLEEDKIPIPEVWLIEDKLYIADGHHRIFDKYLRERKEIKVLCHSISDCGVSRAAYDDVTEKILQQAKEIENRGIYHIEDLILA